jgi:ankyrin repeat protein
MAKLIVSNPNTDLNRTDNYGVNAFWIASFYGNLEIMKFLKDQGIDILC